MASTVKGVPEGYSTVTPNVVIRDAAKAIDFYRRAFGAEEIMRMPGPDGTTIAHAEIRIGSSILMLSDEMPEMECRSPQSLGGSPVSFYVYVPDVDSFFKKAVTAGATEKMPVADMFWGDRVGGLTDPYGHKWTIATHTKDLTPEQIRKGAEAFFSRKS